MSLVVAAAISPALADSIAWTSPAVLGMISMFKSLKSCNCVAVCDNRDSPDIIEFKREEHTHRRYESF